MHRRAPVSLTHRRMQRLSGLDASFLYLETSDQPMHVCSIMGLGTSTMSLNGDLDVGLISCPELLPDLWAMADEFAVGIEELLAVASGR